MAANLILISILVLFPALMTFSASSDLFTMTIPNRLCVALVVGYLVLAVAVGMPPKAIAIDFSCGLAMLILTFTMFSRGWIGGGDAKLAAATALWLGWALIFDYGLIASVLGGVLTLGLLLGRRAPLPDVSTVQNRGFLTALPWPRRALFFIRRPRYGEPPPVCNAEY
jgi:prepilin peptidase CpaA